MRWSWAGVILMIISDDQHQVIVCGECGLVRAQPLLVDVEQRVDWISINHSGAAALNKIQQPTQHLKWLRMNHNLHQSRIQPG